MKPRPCRLSTFLVSALVLLGASPMPARSQQSLQVFFDSLFVHRKTASCVVTTTSGGVPLFRCPPLPGGPCPCVPSTLVCDSVSVASADTACGGNFTGNGIPSINPCTTDEKFPGTSTPISNPTCTAQGSPFHSGFGNISNDPHIEFDQTVYAAQCTTNLGNTQTGVPPLLLGDVWTNVCNADIFLCATVGYGNTASGASDVPIDSLSFELFKFQDGSNPLDPASTPPLRTFFIDAPGVIPAKQTSEGGGGGTPLGPFCALWDGSVNIQGEFGKTNGQYGFRAIVQTNVTGQSGNVTISATRAYPSGATRDANFALGNSGTVVSQKPVQVDVTDVHVVRSSPTIVGAITGVPAEPYNITYRLSKDATMYVTITDPVSGNQLRSVVPGLPRVGEGTPNGTLTNGDAWNGREDNGDLAPQGVYIVSLQAFSIDQYGSDLSVATTRQIAIDPLQITDLRVQPLLEGSTSLAVLSYTLTEPATTFIDIYPPNTQFCSGLAGVTGLPDQSEPGPPKDFEPSLSGCNGAPGVPGSTAVSLAAPLRRLVEQKNSRASVISFWDGRDSAGHILGDGDYVFVIYAALPSQNGTPFLGPGGEKRIWTTTAKSGLLSILRGYVGVSQITPASTVIGSSPSVAGLNPFFFRYTLSRDAIVNLKIFDSSGVKLVKTIVNNEMRPGLFGNLDEWVDGVGDNGLVVSSGAYLAQLTAADPLFPAKVSTTTAIFPVNLLRITDVQTTPLLSGTSDLVLLSYQLSQPMNVAWNIYPPGTVILNSTTTWPPCQTLFPSSCGQILNASQTVPVNPLITVSGLRAGRLKITEQWDGRDANGLLVPDGQYVFTLTAQSTTTPQYFPTDRVYGTLTVQRGAIIFPSFSVTPDVPQLFNSSNTITTLPPFTVSYSLTRQSSVTIQILTASVPPAVVRNLVSGQFRENGVLLEDVWDGRDDNGNFPPAGFYVVRAVASDLASQLSSGSTAQVTISFDPLRIYDVAVTPLRADTRGSSLLYQVSETMKTSVKIYRPGTVFDAAGNPSPPERVSLVKRIVGVKPARTALEDVWDGTDLRLSLVPDGTYKFKIVASTDIKAIDDVTGNVLNPSALSLDRPIDEIPVVRNASLDPQGDFERNTFAYPNPVTGPSATFSIYTPFQGDVKMRIYNVAGRLVFEKDFGEQAPSFASGPLTFAWDKTNEAGRAVARGIYYAVIRVDETLGGKNILQTVKKLLLP